MSVLSWEEDINRDSPYKVSVFTDTYALKFFTASGLEYVVSFIRDEMLADTEINAFQLLVEARDYVHSSNDTRLGETVAVIVRSFLSLHPDYVITYICDIKDSQQSARNRLFSRWFNKYSHGDFLKKDWCITADGSSFYASLIGVSSNKQLPEIIDMYNTFSISLNK